MLKALMREKQSQVTWTLIHADDTQLLALWRSYRDIAEQLGDKPAACRYYASGGGESVSKTDETTASYAAEIAAYQSGAANLASGKGPALPSPEMADLLLEKSTAIGKPYSEAEWAALNRGYSPNHAPSDTVACGAYIKLYQNMLRLPDPEAAQLIRYHRGGWIADQLAAKHGK
jgi:hypothetical protein